MRVHSIERHETGTQPLSSNRFKRSNMSSLSVLYSNEDFSDDGPWLYNQMGMVVVLYSEMTHCSFLVTEHWSIESSYILLSVMTTLVKGFRLTDVAEISQHVINTKNVLYHDVVRFRNFDAKRYCPWWAQRFCWPERRPAQCLRHTEVPEIHTRNVLDQ